MFGGIGRGIIVFGWCKFIFEDKWDFFWVFRYIWEKVLKLCSNVDESFWGI